MTRSALPVLALALVASACGSGERSAPTSGAPGDTTARSPITARIEAGVQVAELTVHGEAFEPAAVRLRTGVPARLVITRTDAPTCADSVKAPDLGLRTTALPVGVPVALEFTPEAAGDYTLACGMDMLAATLVVQ